MNPSARKRTLMKRLQTALKPVKLDVVDDTDKHAGHAGSKGGLSHFQIEIVSPLFEGHNLVKRHRMVYEALGDMMHEDIHALAIQAHTQEEIS